MHEHYLSVSISFISGYGDDISGSIIGGGIGGGLAVGGGVGGGLAGGVTGGAIGGGSLVSFFFLISGFPVPFLTRGNDACHTCKQDSLCIHRLTG